MERLRNKHVKCQWYVAKLNVQLQALWLPSYMFLTTRFYTFAGKYQYRLLVETGNTSSKYSEGGVQVTVLFWKLKPEPHPILSQLSLYHIFQKPALDEVKCQAHTQVLLWCQPLGSGFVTHLHIWWKTYQKSQLIPQNLNHQIISTTFPLGQNITCDILFWKFSQLFQKGHHPRSHFF